MVEFRLWDPKERRMHPVRQITFGDGQFPPGVMGLGFRHYSLSDIELMQWSGLVDVNGQKIFEKDIVKTPTAIVSANRLYRTVIVGYRVKDGCWTLESDDFVKTVQRYKRLTEKTIKQDNICVLGNTFENPELVNLWLTQDGQVVTQV